MPNIKHKIYIMMIFQEIKFNHGPKKIAWHANHVPEKQGMTYKNIYNEPPACFDRICLIYQNIFIVWPY